MFGLDALMLCLNPFELLLCFGPFTNKIVALIRKSGELVLDRVALNKAATAEILMLTLLLFELLFVIIMIMIIITVVITVLIPILVMVLVAIISSPKMRW